MKRINYFKLLLLSEKYFIWNIKKSKVRERPVQFTKLFPFLQIMKNQRNLQKQVCNLFFSAFINKTKTKQKDNEIFDIAWNEEFALSTWHSVLQIFSKLNQTLEPKKHAACIRKIINVIDYLIAAEAEIPYSVLCDGI